MRLDPATSRRLFGEAKVARLATVGTAGPHLVPIVFAPAGDTIVSVIDRKPKRAGDLRRLTNLAHEPRAALLVDRYDDADWEVLWWVRADVVAAVSSDPATLGAAVHALQARYPQYVTQVPQGPVITMTVQRWVGWAASPRAIAG